MHVEQHRWFSHRTGREMPVRVYGHYGAPILGFPTSGGDERELEGQGLIGALAHHIDAGKVKFYCIDTANNQSWYDEQAHPRHRSYVQAMFDAYVASEVVPFIHDHCKGAQPITTMGASFGAYHAANTLFKHPDVVKRCLALSGVYDIRKFMNGDYDDNFYFNNPIDYVRNLDDGWFRHHLASCDIRLATGTGQWEDSGPTYRFSEVLKEKGINHSLDDWGPDGGHDWPYWKRMMDLYIQRLF
ncbi:MAG: esterase [Vicinamibacteria bacterium]|nr:esterase [Vicinamibacteria bacterium]